MLRAKLVGVALGLIASVTPAFAAGGTSMYFWCPDMVLSRDHSVKISTGITIVANTGAIIAGLPPVDGTLLDKSGPLISFSTPEYLWMLNVKTARAMFVQTENPTDTLKGITATTGFPNNSYAGQCVTS